MEATLQPSFVSMTRVGSEFGWSVREIARVLEEHGYRKHGRPTPKGMPWVEVGQNPVGEDSFRWDLAGMVEQLQALGYEKAHPVRVQTRLLLQDCQKFNDYRHKYVQGPKRKQAALGAITLVASVANERLSLLPAQARAQVLLAVEQHIHHPRQESLWPEHARKELWKWLGVSVQELQACALLVATEDAPARRPRPRI